MKAMKKILSVLLIVVFCAQSVISVCANENKVDLRQLSKEECLEVLVDNGLTIPDSYRNHPDVAGFVKNVVNIVYEQPDKTSWYNFTYAQEFAENIREVVIEYADLSTEVPVSMQQSRAVNSLRYSTPIDSWNGAYALYNCYAYAIGRETFGDINPGYSVGVDYTTDILATMTIDRLASLVTYDLQNLGHTNITYSRTLPEYESLYSIIAIRKNSNDYHVMWMYSSQPIWRHKPHQSVVLQYNYSSVTNGMWTDEGLYQTGYKTYTNIYDSDIIYIKYKN